MPHADPVLRSEYQRLYRLKRKAMRPVSARTQAKAWNEAVPTRSQFLNYITHVRHKFGISFVKYLSALHGQNYRCARCRTSNWGTKGGIKRPCVDHDHTTGRFRGLLCFNCNVVLGRLGDDVLGVRNESNSYLAYLQGCNVER